MSPQNRAKEDKRRHQHASYLVEDTIISRITGPGGAIAALRLSGPETLYFLKTLCPEVIKFEPRRLELVEIYSRDKRKLDQAVVVFFKGPQSYTGEDVAEFFLHGGGLVSSLVLEELLALGARQALPGEYSFRAVRNGKLSLDQAQAVHDLVSATNVSAHGLAIERLSGGQAHVFASIAESLRQSLSMAEAGIDFSDQDLEELGLDRLKRGLREIQIKLVELGRSIERGKRIQEGIPFVLVGPPNVGKSTLFNELLGEERSLTSDEAGTTRDLIRESVRLRSSDGGIEATLILHDTAGLRLAGGKIEEKGIELSRASVSGADVVVFVLEPTSPEAEVLSEWEKLGRPKEKSILVLNKSDFIRSEPGVDSAKVLLEKWKRLLDIQDVALVSAVSQTGTRELIDLLLARAKKWVERQPAEVIFTRQEQVDAVNRAVESLDRAQRTSSHDVFSADLRQALQELSFFIGETPVEDVLGRIFSQFCIGK